MEGLFQPTHLLIIAALVFLLFGGKKLPELGKGLGAGIREFKDAMRGGMSGGGDSDKKKDDANKT